MLKRSAAIQHHMEILAKLLTSKYRRHNLKSEKEWRNFVSASVVGRVSIAARKSWGNTRKIFRRAK